MGGMKSGDLGGKGWILGKDACFRPECRSKSDQFRVWQPSDPCAACIARPDRGPSPGRGGGARGHPLAYLLAGCVPFCPGLSPLKVYAEVYAAEDVGGRYSVFSMGYWPYLAERVGFEPTVRFHVHTLSKRAP